jgi:hypothetical protein
MFPYPCHYTTDNYAYCFQRKKKDKKEKKKRGWRWALGGLEIHSRKLGLGGATLTHTPL